MPDRIHIESLELFSFLGVPEEERASEQRLQANLLLEPLCDFRALDDRLENTIDYAAVCEVAKALSRARPRKLLETLAEEMAATLLARFPLHGIEVELRKFILPDTAFVAVQIRRERSTLPS